MIKFLKLALFIFFLQNFEGAYSQTNNDSTINSSLNDTISGGGDESVEKTAIDTDDIYNPVSDTAIPRSSEIRQVSQRNINAYLKNPDYAYANDPDYWREKAPVKPGYISKFIDSRALQWVIFLIIGSVLLYGIYRLAKEGNFIWFFRRRNQIVSQEGYLSPSGKIDYDGSILSCQNEGDYRQAVRFMYLKAIETIRQYSIISIRNSSTNAEISRSFLGNPYATDFRYLANAYEYIYYGEFVPSGDLYIQLKKKFDDFQQKLSV